MDELETLVVGTEWALPVTTAASFFSLQAEDYLRFAYKRGVFPETTVGPDSVETFAEFVEGSGYPGFSDFLFRSGYLLGTTRRVELLETFLSATLSRLQGFPIDRGLLDTSDEYVAVFLDLELVNGCLGIG